MKDDCKNKTQLQHATMFQNTVVIEHDLFQHFLGFHLIQPLGHKCFFIQY